VHRRRTQARDPACGLQPDLPAVTVLKPLHGSERGLYDCLRSFCEQDYPRFQIVCGVREADDAAVAVVRALQAAYPRCDLQLEISAQRHGANAKVSNLINLMRLARHDHLIVSDSDVRVPPGYLAKVVTPLLDPAVGIVTCAYRGFAGRGLWSLLGSLFINEWFMPSVRVAALSGSASFAFGATIAIRRAVLEGIGGFAAIADQLADDYRLGELTRRMGLRTVLSDVVVETCVDERSLGDLVRHELRWLRTIRAVRPVGYALSFVTLGVPVAALGCVLADGSGAAIALLCASVAARLLLHFRTSRPGQALAHLWVLPLNDVLVFTLWCRGLTGSRVQWRDAWYRVTRDGTVQPIP
jgi:ceramide glucosyltransferase